MLRIAGVLGMIGGIHSPYFFTHMMHKFIPGILVVLLCGAAVALAVTLTRPNAETTRSTTEPTPTTEEGDTTVVDSKRGRDDIEMIVDGNTREFIVYRPEQLNEDEVVPVVFMFHGSGGTGEKFFDISGWREKADQEGFMVVFPTALKYHVYSEEKVVNGVVKYDVAVYQTKWNQFGLEEQLDPAFPDQTLADDVKFTQEMVAYVQENYATDPDRFYATGFSNGAAFTARLLVQMWDVFAAFGPSGAGRVTNDMFTRTNEYADGAFVPRPTMLMLGELDPKLTYSAGVDAFPMDETLAEPGYVMKDYVIDIYLDLLGLSDTYAYERTNRVSHFTFSDSAETPSADAFHVLIMENMKHIYPNGTNYPLEAADMYWTFFEAYTL